MKLINAMLIKKFALAVDQTERIERIEKDSKGKRGSVRSTARKRTKAIRAMKMAVKTYMSDKGAFCTLTKSNASRNDIGTHANKARPRMSTSLSRLQIESPGPK